MINAKVTGDEEIIVKFGRINSTMSAKMARCLTGLAIDVTSHAKFQKLSGQVLKVRTGRLRRSIKYHVVSSKSKIMASVSTNVEYGRIHEYGGRTRRAIMPERSFLRSSLRELKTRIVSELEQAAKQAINEAMT